MRAADEPDKGNYEQVVIVTRRTQLEELVARFNTRGQARFYLEHEGLDFAPIEQAHERFHDALGRVRAAIPHELRQQTIDRTTIPQFSFAERDLIVVVGQDGLVANTAKYAGQTPIIAVNPDPALFDGVLLPFEAREFGAVMDRVLSLNYDCREVTLAEATLSDGQRLLAFNDFFVGARSHVSARYSIRRGEREERQSSSGIIVSTGAGSTGWLQSVYAGAAGIVSALGGQPRSLPDDGRMPWDSDELIYAVREPFPSRVTGTSMVFGSATRSDPLIVVSEMATDGRIFSDGVEDDFLEFNSGTKMTVAPAAARARLVSAA